MPFDPAALGDELIDAGKKQTSTGKKLKQSAVQLRRFGDALKSGEQIDDSLISIADGASSIRDLLGPVNNALLFIRNAFNGFRVPTINQQSRNIDIPVVGRVRVLTGITIGSTNPLAATAARVEIVRDNIINIRNALRTITDGLGDLRDELPDIRKNLTNAAGEMDSAGAELIDAGKALQVAGKGLGGG